LAGYRVAAIEDGGIAIELIETNLSDDELCELKRQSVLYSDDPSIRHIAIVAAADRL
jgi:hypothetical protein